MAIVSYERWSLLTQLQRGPERSFADTSSEGLISTDEWAPAVDIKEDTSKFVLHADIPGVKPEEIEVNMDGGVLTIIGEKKSEAKTEKEVYKRGERIYGSFYRRFYLPNAANADGICARLKDGILEIIIPKRKAVLPKRINVAVATEE